MLEFFYYNTTDPYAEARPLHNGVEFVDERAVQDQAERCDYLIIFLATRDDINKAARLGQQITYEQYEKDMREHDTAWTKRPYIG